MSYWYYPSSGPKAVKGGIKAQSKRGDFAAHWWAQRWIAVLESFHIGARLDRGRTYARKGQVINIDIAKGRVRAQVQGSRRKPYEVTIKIKTLTKTNWRRLAKALSTQLYFLATLLAGDMPPEIETVFSDLGLSLFPKKLKDLETDCSCPDWSNPCKHIAAVFYLLGEAFDQDPFLMLKLRGLEKDELLELLAPKHPAPQQAVTEAVAPPKLVPEPLSSETAIFWHGAELPEDLFGAVRLPPINAMLPKRLGKFPFWRGSCAFLESMESIYQKAADKGLTVYLGERNYSNSHEIYPAQPRG
ncbi:MAG: SWIM zinc finger family protein [Desulfobacca sp.]|nr:SWIM zinc finger family protein [Desulfobacca sp.]